MFLANLNYERNLTTKCDTNFRNPWILFTILFFIFTAISVFAADQDKASHRSATAIRITDTPPQMDGVWTTKYGKSPHSTKAFANANRMKRNP